MTRATQFCLTVLFVTAIAFRCIGLEDFPGVNGDEAWYGNLVHDISDGQPRFLTPSRIPVNPFYVLPMLATHLVVDDSVTALRLTAVLSGLIALVLNFCLARRMFDRPTAITSTTILAVLPILIAYSRFGWDTAQMPIAALCVVYSAMNALRSPTDRSVRVAWLTLIASLLVHPTALFLAPLTLLGTWHGLLRDAPWLKHVSRWLPIADESSGSVQVARDLKRSLVLTALAMLASIAVNDWSRGNLLPFASVVRLMHFGALFGDLFTGRTVFLFVSGGTGVDAIWVLGRFVVLGLTVWAFIASMRSENPADRLLSHGLLLGLAAFFVAGGPSALVPGYERYGVFMVVPIVALWTRSLLTSRLAESHAVRGIGFVAAVLLLGAFRTLYFEHMRETGGSAAMTFRYQNEGIHARAASRIRESAHGAATTVITANFHLEQPLRYLLHAGGNFTVVNVRDLDELQATVSSTRNVWVVDFSSTEDGRPSPMIEWALLQGGLSSRSLDAGGHDVLEVVQLDCHPEVTVEDSDTDANRAVSN